MAYKKTMMNDLDFPQVVLIDTVSYCNLKCSMCSHRNMKRPKGKMKWTLYKKIVDEIAEENTHTRIWPVFFGESLILKKTKPSIFDMIKYAKKRGIGDVALNTNACLLDKESAKNFIDSGLDSIHIGIDAFSAETYSKLRVGGNYSETLNNVLQLIDINNASGKRLKIRVQFVEMQENHHEINNFVKFWISKGVDVKLRKELTWSGLLSDPNRKNDLIDKERHECYWISDTMSITDRGDVVTCAADPEGRSIMGNVKRESLKEIWSGELRRLRALHIKNEWEKLPFPCNICPDWKISYKDKIIRPKKNMLKKYLDKLKHFSNNFIVRRR